MNKEIQFLMYSTPQGDVNVKAVVRDETLWLTQKAMDQLFGVQVHAISKHLKNIFAEGEMDAHLTQESRESDNRRNGKMQKQVQTPVGDITVTAPRDRDASFDPQFIKKREQALGTSAVGLKRQLAHPYLPRL